MKARIVTKTTQVKQYLEEKVATSMYDRLVKLPWVEGVKSKKGFTRLAYTPTRNFDSEITKIIETAVSAYIPNSIILGVYINYYKNGEMYTPSHTHPGTVQLIISLGATRTLKIGKTDYKMENGDLAFFGSSSHGVPKEPDVKKGRISIAVFVQRL